MKDFMKRYKPASRDVKGAPECMRIIEFVHGITNPKLLKRLHDKIPKTVDEMMSDHIFPQEGSSSFESRTKEVVFIMETARGKEQPKAAKKGETSGKDKALAILMVQPWERVARQNITQSFSPNLEIFFPPLGEDKGIEGPMIIEAEIGGHCIHRMYVDATTPLIGFSDEIIWPIGKIQLLVKIKDEEHSIIVWINFVVVRSPSPSNEVIGRSRVKKLQAVPSTTHGMLKLPKEEGGIILKSSRLVPLKCAMVFGPERNLSVTKKIVEERVRLENVRRFQGLKQSMPKRWLFAARNRLEAAFWLENAGATCQRLVDKAFHKQIGRNLKVYVDDLVIKSRTEDEIVRDAEDTFKTLKEINMKLNPKKCTFEVEEGMFLGYTTNTKGRKVCPNKVDAVLSLPSPKCLKDVQKLNENLVSLNRFLAKSAENSLPFFKTFKKYTKKSDFDWITIAEEAFKQMKQLIAELPMLTAPVERKELIVYLAAVKEMVTASLMTKREAKQMPIYFVSRALRGPEINYTSRKKLALALVHANKRLKRYFQAHPIIVIIDQPIQHVLSRPEVAGRLQKWSIELREYAIYYRPRVSVKGKILDDFIVERPEKDAPDTLMEMKEELLEPWILFTDRLSCTNGSEAGLIFTNPEGM
nr:reverse transcriptase domain-containing protein [Tanacetum cinerariifolium]